MLIAANPWSFHFFTHSLCAVPPPPCTSTIAGTLPFMRRGHSQPGEDPGGLSLPGQGLEENRLHATFGGHALGVVG